MSGYVVLAIIILAGIIQASLQLGTGCLLLLYKGSLEQSTKKKSKKLAKHYIMGYAFYTALMLMAAAFSVSSLIGRLSIMANTIVALVLCGVAVLMWFFYNKFGYSTELWLPKSVKRYMNKSAKTTKSKIEAFSLGNLSCFAEMPFSLFLYLLTANCILYLNGQTQMFAVMLFIVLSISPLLLVDASIKTGKNLADIQKWRLKNIGFIKAASGVGFVILALFVIAFCCMGVA